MMQLLFEMRDRKIVSLKAIASTLVLNYVNHVERAGELCSIEWLSHGHFCSLEYSRKFRFLAAESDLAISSEENTTESQRYTGSVAL